MRIADAKERVLTLTPEDYVRGPTPRSAQSSQEAWVFELCIDDTSIYVKVSVRLEPARCICVSFHDAQWPLNRPYGQDDKRGDDPS